LKTQIRQLTEGDDNTSNAVGPNAAAVKNSALESSIATAKKSINQSNTSAGNRQAIAGYSKEIEAYQEAYGKPTQANLDANLPARVDSINKIISKYKKSGVDLTAANKESAYLTKTLNEKKYQYALSMKFYSKLVENGSSIDDRKTMIELIIKKYKIYGFDITKAQDELKRISQPTAN
jgi:hypothetical protein